MIDDKCIEWKSEGIENNFLSENSLKSLGNYGRIELEMKKKENVCE